ncbi:MAG TPA: class I SAM-dependent RNA methyltransferase [Candidatus Limnocylindrales bacterium]|jgi:tRNA/tmRNA/rRNA uracil-C5-methylase (TrmA/RlmC/RlmD family)|nr:class I SAM-dependent RNA methyltransferase [Candidatus Limnocylindrales bacterium]
MGLNVGDKVQLTITDIAFGGEGVARIEDFVVFVPFVIVGEQVEAEVTELKKRFARAKLVRLLRPFPERVQPPCPYFGDCGGCQYQHLTYSSQLELKHKQISDIFQRLGDLNPGLVKNVIPCPQPYGYRNRIMIRTQWDKFKQGLNIGFIRADNRLVVDIQECKIAEPALNAQIKQVRAHPPPKGGLKVVLRISPEGWEVPPDSFFQNNFFLLPGMVEVVRAHFKQSGSCFLLDIYCGVGFFSLELADLAESFIGVEYDRLAIKAARQNAATRNITNGEFVAGTAEELLPQLLHRHDPACTTVLLDPPRKGCRPELLDLLLQTKPAQIIYVSCQPATMARDLKILSADQTFLVREVVPLDMFPQTAHIECVADVRLTST